MIDKTFIYLMTQFILFIYGLAILLNTILIYFDLEYLLTNDLSIEVSIIMFFGIFIYMFLFYDKKIEIFNY